MLVMSIEEIVSAVKGQVFSVGNKQVYSSISIDTRKELKDSLFIAIKGENFNGNTFIPQAVEKGALICIADEICFTEEQVTGATVIVVKDTRKAIGDLARYYLSKLSLKIIAVTGSTGKTTTKDMIAAVLSSKYKVFKTKGNFNNDIGLPLMVFQLDESYDAAVLEMGMSDFKEIEYLAGIANPDIAVITNIGISHIENLGSRDNILKAKMEITSYFNEKNILILNGEDDLLKDINSNRFKVVKTGNNEDFDFIAKDLSIEEAHISYTVREQANGQYAQIKLDMPGVHNVFNSLLAVACARSLSMSYEEICEGFKKLEPTSRRLDILKYKRVTLIDDCYNASPDSVKAALQVLQNIRGKRRLAILGTMKELGNEAYNAHKVVAEFAKDKGIDFLCVVSEFEGAFKEGFQGGENFNSFKNTEEVVEYLDKHVSEGDVILVKASRSMKFETIVEALKKNTSLTGGHI